VIERGAVAALAFAAAVTAFPTLAQKQFQPRKVVFINETPDHKHDRDLRASSRIFQEATGINLGVVLLRELPPDTSIEGKADDLFARLKLGRKSDGKALLYVWSERERVFKIEVSYDLEGVFPDALCSRLEQGARTFMLSTSPYARRDFIVELNVTLKLHYLEYQRRGGATSPVAVPVQGHRYVGDYLHGGAGVVGRNYAATVDRVLMELKPLPPSLASEMQPGRTPKETLDRYIRSLELGVGEPNVPLLTEASRAFRMDKPHAPGYMKRIHKYISESGPYELVAKDDLAVARWPYKAPVLPVFLRRDAAGFWFVDEPKAWATVHLFQDGSHMLKYRDAPYAFGIATPPRWPDGYALFQDRAKPPPLLPLASSVRVELAKAEEAVLRAPANVAAWVRLADLLHFEVFWLQSAERVYEHLLTLAPERTDLRWRLVDIYQMTSDVEGQNRLWCEILRTNPGDSQARYLYDWLRKAYYWEDEKAGLCRS